MVKKWIKSEFWNGYNWYERVFMLSMILLQVIMYLIVPDSLIGMVCGISGVICVVLTAKGKISSYIFNFIQMITYMIICWNTRLFIEFGEQVFYFIACIFGVFLWKDNMKVDKVEGSISVIARKFKLWQWIAVAISTALCTYLLGSFGKVILDSTLPYIDAFTVSLSVIAQLLMILRYREQWVIWVIIDIANIALFIMLGQWSMVVMYIAWTINAFYGWYNWTKLNKSVNN